MSMHHTWVPKLERFILKRAGSFVVGPSNIGGPSTFFTGESSFLILYPVSPKDIFTNNISYWYLMVSDGV